MILSLSATRATLRCGHQRYCRSAKKKYTGKEGKERNGKERKGRKGKERKGKERKGRKEDDLVSFCDMSNVALCASVILSEENKERMDSMGSSPKKARQMDNHTCLHVGNISNSVLGTSCGDFLCSPAALYRLRACDCVFWLCLLLCHASMQSCMQRFVFGIHGPA